LGTDPVTFSCADLSAPTRDRVCGAAVVRFCASGVLQGINSEIATTTLVRFGAVGVALSNRRVLGVAESEIMGNRGRG